MKIDINRVAAYLAGNFPPYYESFPKLEFIILLNSKAEDIFEKNNRFDLIEKHTNSLQQFFSESLNLLKGKPELLNEIIHDLNIPFEARGSDFVQPIDLTKQINLQEIEEFLDKANEEDFSRFIIMPILEAMGYEEIEYKGKVNETDFGLDFYPVKYVSPSGIVHYAGVQAKSTKMTQGDNSDLGKELKNLIEETDTAFDQPHRLRTGEKVRITEYIVINSKTVTESARNKYFESSRIKDKKIKFFAKDGVLRLVSQYGLQINLK